MKIAILGAGVIGVTTAYFLGNRGHDVTVIDREPESAMECSFANGGQLSYSHGEPWASPSSLKKAITWLMKDDAPLKFRFRIDPAMWRWTSQFLLQCSNAKVMEHTEQLVRLGLYSRKVMHQILSEQPLECSYTQAGILHYFESKKSFNAFRLQSEFQRPLGVEFDTLTPEEVLKKEPALHTLKDKLVGGIFYPLDEAADVHAFTMELTERDKLIGSGVKFLHSTTIESINRDGERICSVSTDKHGEIEADMFIVCLGAYSPLLLNPLGIYVPVYPMKGYSISIPVSADAAPEDAPTLSLTDHSYKVVFSRLGNILRLAGTAEFDGYNHEITEKRIELLKTIAYDIFPECGDIDQAESWACLRPSTPAGPPLLGKTPIDNLLLNTGHGTLGWTQAAGSAKIVADIAEGKDPEIDLDGLCLKSRLVKA